MSQDPERVAALTSAFRRLGLDEDVDARVASELREGIPQLTRYRFLSLLWPKMIDSWHGKVGREPLDDDWSKLGRTPLMSPSSPGWSPTKPSSQCCTTSRTTAGMTATICRSGRWSKFAPEEEPRERRVSALFEDLLGMDPVSGRLNLSHVWVFLNILIIIGGATMTAACLRA